MSIHSRVFGGTNFEPSTLVELLRWRAENFSHNRAYTYLQDGEERDIRVTYLELDRRARAIGAWLQSLGASGERALLIYPPGIEYVTAFFGCLYAGVTAVPAYPPDPTRLNRTLPRLQAIARDAQAALVLTNDSILSMIKIMRIGSKVTDSLEKVPFFKKFGSTLGSFLSQRAAILHAKDLSDLQWLSTEDIKNEMAEDWKEPEIDKDTLAFLQYTSGSTGMPRGVMLSHENLLYNLALIYEGFAFTPECEGVIWLPIYHDMGLIGGVLQPLYSGMACTLMSPIDFLQRPLRWLTAISRITNAPVISGGPNFAYDLCARKITPEQKQKLSLGHWKVAFSGAEPVRPETIDRFTSTFEPCGFKREAFYPCYGLAEATLFVSGGYAADPPIIVNIKKSELKNNRFVETSADQNDSQPAVGCGHTYGDQIIAIVNPETSEECGPQEIGEVWISGTSVARGYYNRPEETQQTFRAQIKGKEGRYFLRTGDMGYLKDGELFITGRIKDLIIIRGRNHYPQDIEYTVENSHPNLRPGCSAVFSVDLENQERLIIVVEVRNPKQLKADEVIDAIKRHVTEAHELQAYAVVLIKPRTISKTSSGKIQRRATKNEFLEGKLQVLAEWRASGYFQTDISKQATLPVESTAAKPTEKEVPPASPQKKAANVAAIESWLINKIAENLEINPDEIDIHEPFVSFGLDSAQAVGLAGDLEEWLGRKLSPTLVWDYPTIESLAAFLAEDKTSAAVPATSKETIASDSEPIAVIGLGCRFPGAKNPRQFWELLVHGVDAISEVPKDRWDLEEFFDPTPMTPGKMYTRWGGFIDDVDKFDALFFGISAKEAADMDPQQRILSEVAWEALEDAGKTAQQLAGSQTGVFIGISSYDYSRLQLGNFEDITPYVGTGNAFSIAANRLSYLFDLKGPSVALDTACSSSLVAVHLACHSLRKGECDMAIAGGVNLILSPEVTINFSQATVMSPTGRCKTFDADADGYVRGEGAGVVVLKPLSKAMADGDRIYAVIRGSAVNSDGRSNGLMAPNRQAQEAVIQEAYKNAGISPGLVQYVEAHGTGTKLGDPIEVRALGAVIAQGRPENRKCAIGSVKSNIGHLEAAAGVAALIKVALSVHHRKLPPSLHYKQPNPFIPFDQLPVVVQQELSDWPVKDEPLIAGITSLGFGGTNCHVVVTEAPLIEKMARGATPKPTARLLPLSAHSDEALKDLAGAYLNYLAEEGQAVSLTDLCYTASLRRTHYSNRMAVVVHSQQELLEHLDAALRDEQLPTIARGTAQTGHREKIVFVFPGQGAQWWAMGHELMQSQPVFRETIEACDKVISQYADWSLIHQFVASEAESQLDRIDIIQPALFAIQIALANLWRSWGIEPDAVVGHSMGEVAAAYVAGVLNLEDAIKVIFHRSRLLKTVAGQGKMAVVELSLTEAEQAIQGLEDKISIAVIAGPKSIVLSGEPQAVEQVVAGLEQRQIFCRMLRVDVASHNPQVEHLKFELIDILKGIQPQPGNIPFYSTVAGKVVNGQELDATYWGRNLREPVRFATAIDQLVQDDFGVFLELNPHPTLTNSIQSELAHLGKKGTVVHSLKREEEEMATMLSALGRLFTIGFPIRWEQFYPEAGQVVSLPTFPWQRERYWFDDGKEKKKARPSSLLTQVVGEGADIHPLLGSRRSSPLLAGKQIWENVVNTKSLAFLLDHKVQDSIVLPATAYLEMAFAASKQAFGGKPFVIENVALQRAMFLPENQNQVIQFVLSPITNGVATFQVYSLADSSAPGKSLWLLHAEGTVRQAEADGDGFSPLAAVQKRCTKSVGVETHYQQLFEHHLNYGESFQGVVELWTGESEALGKLQPPAAIEAELNEYLLHPALLDAGLQVLSNALPFEMDDERADVYLPIGFQKIAIRHFRRPVWSYTKVYPIDEPNPLSLTSDVVLYDEAGEVIGQIDGLKLQRLGRQKSEDLTSWLYEIVWDEKTIDHHHVNRRQGDWLIFNDRANFGLRIASELQAKGKNCIIVQVGNEFRVIDQQTYQVQPDNPDHFVQLFAAAFGESARCAGIVYLWGLNGTATAELTIGALSADQFMITNSVANLIRGLNKINWQEMPQLYLVTQNAQIFDLDGRNLSVSQSTIWGLGRVIAQEHPELKCKLLDLDADSPEQLLNLIMPEFLYLDREDQVLFRKQKRYVARLSHLSPDRLGPFESERIGGMRKLARPDSDAFRLEVGVPGVLDGLQFKPITRPDPADNQVEIEVHATGLNFMDVMNALGLLPGDSIPLGAECAGVISRISPEVTGLKVGDEVMGLAPASFGSYAVSLADLLVRKPKSLSFEEAATIPVTFLTAYYGIVHQARLRQGEKILIHAGAGGVGLSAIQIAQMIGAEIFATAGSEEKRAYLRSLGIAYVMDSRTLDFADQILAYTNGRGIDVVLNSLSGEAIPRSLSVLADYGRFVEIGKTDIYSHGLLDLFPFRKNLSYFAVDLLRIAKDKPALVQDLFQELLRHFEAGQLKPIPATVFALEDSIHAFRYMAQRKNIGKIVISKHATPVQDEMVEKKTLPIHGEASYLITGGLGALGLLVAKWLVRNGAKHLVLLEPPAVSIAAKQSQLDELEKMGASVTVARADVADADQMASVFTNIKQTLPALKGIVHAAGLLDDSVLLQLTPAQFDRVMKPKVHGAWNLHTLTLDQPLDFFILFSSAAAIFGSPGQANYVAANTFMDSLAHYRHALGLPAMAINWAAWAQIGLAARADRGGRLATKGFQTIAPEKGIAVFETLMQQPIPQIVVAPINWKQVLQLYPDQNIPPLVSNFAAEKIKLAKKAEPTRGQAILTREELVAVAPEKRQEVLSDYLQKQLSRVLGVPSSKLDLHKPLNMMGMDSLMAIELKNNLETNLGIVLPVAMLLQGPSAMDLVQHVVSQLADVKPEAVQTTTEHPADEFIEHPLSHGQKALWFQYQVNPESIYNMVYAVRIRSEVDFGRMKQAFQRLVDRHPVLRSTFAVREGEPVQLIHPKMDVFFRIEDVSSLDEEAIRQRLETEAKQPFDFEHGPLMKVWVFSRSDRDHFMLFVSHHIITDLWSQTVLLYELSQIYSQVEGEVRLAPLKTQFKDFVAEETRYLSDAQAEADLAYWRQKLAGDLPDLDLPLDLPRPAVQTFKGRSVSARIDAELVQKLKLLGEKHGATTFMILLAAYDVLLHRYTSQEDIVVGSPTTGRTRSEFANVIGYFVNPIPFRSAVYGHQTVAELLDQVKNTVVEGLQHQDYPFPLIVEKIHPHRDPSRTPVFQTMLVLEKAHLSEIQELSSFALGEEGEQMNLGGLPLESVTLEQNVAPFDLTLMVTESPRGMAVSFTYNIDLFQEASIARLLNNFIVVLENFASRPEAKVAEVALPEESELKLLLEKFNETDHEFPANQCIHELFEARVAKNAHALAVVFDEEKLTYGELNARANQLAHYLQKGGVKPETVVGICVERSMDMLVAMLGVLKAGGAYLPLDPIYPVERLKLMLADSRASFLITQQRLNLNIAGGETQVIRIDSDWGNIARESTENPISGAQPENLAYMIYTSGSTGTPKGTLVQHRSLCNFATAHVRALGVDSSSRWLQFASFSFDASVSEIFTALMAGGALFLASRETILATSKLTELLISQQINTAILPPAVLSILPQEKLPGLQTVISAGEALPVDVVTRWSKGRKFFNGYGPTEATVGPTLYRVEDFDERETNVPIGRPLDNIKVYILDRELKPVPLGAAGELHIGGVCLARGYYQRPDLTAEKFIPDPFSSMPGARLYRTGDLARFRADGTILFLGRVDFQVKIRGFRIELEEIESNLKKHPAVESVVVSARKDRSGENQLVAYFIHDHQPTPEPDELRNFLKQMLPDYMVPNFFVPLESFPLTPSGKIDRKALPEPQQWRSVSEANYVKPRTETEALIASIWQDVLKLERIGIHDNFFDIGGHSLAMAKVHNKLCEQMQRDISIVELFKYPTIHSLAHFLNQTQAAKPIYEEKQQRASRQREALGARRDRMMNRRPN